jgi:WD40 repeat protein
MSDLKVTLLETIWYKTALTVKLAQRVQADFRWVVWRSLRSAPPLKELLTDLIQVLSAQRITAATLVDSVDAQITALVTLLQMRCLVVLDNMETILQPEQLGAYRPGYEEYEDLLRRMGTTTHNSCLIITSRECPENLTTLQGSTVRSLALTGVDQSTGYSILQQSLTSVEENLSDQLVQSYQGNPFALILTASTIQTLFNGDAAQFLSQQPQLVFGDLRRLIDQHFQRLSLLEQAVMYWLAIAQEPVTLHDLQEDIISIPGQDQDVLEALIRLKGRSLIENITIAGTTIAKTTGFTQQPVVMEYVIDRLIQQVSQEIADWEEISIQQNVLALPLLHTHALLKATAKDYIRDTQTRLILKPIGDRVKNYPLKRLIARCRNSSLLSTGYAVGNFLNLLGCTQSDLTGLDCSGLTVRQADFRNVTLHQVNFTQADLTQSIFAETFSSVLCVAFSPSGEMVATSTSSGKVHQWCVRDGRHYLVFQSSVFQRQGDWCYAIDYSQDGQWLASGGSGRTVELWNLKTGKCWRSLNEHMAGVRTLHFSPDSCLLATAGVDRTIRIWDVNTTDCIQVLIGHEGTVQSIAFAPDGRSIASGAADSTLKIWNLSTGNCLNLVGHTVDVRTVAYSPDGKTLASAGDDRLIRLWSASTGQSQRILQEHTNAIYSIAYSPDGKTLASAGDDQVIRLWDSSTGTLQKSLVGHQSRIWSIAFSPDGRTLVSGSAESKNSADRTIRFWQVETGQLQKTLQGYYRWTSPIAFSSDGSTLLTLCDDRRLRWWLIETGTYRTVTLDIQGSHNATLSPDGCTLVTGSFYDTEIKLFDAYSGQIRKRLTEHTDWVIMAVFNLTGRLMASASSDRTIKLWDTQTGTCLRSFQGHHAPVCCVAFRPNRDVIASGSWDGTVKLWSMTTGECLTTLPQHLDQVGVVMFSPNGQLLFSASQDGLVRFWDVESRKLLQEYNSDDYINRTSFAFSPNSQQFWLLLRLKRNGIFSSGVLGMV